MPVTTSFVLTTLTAFGGGGPLLVTEDRVLVKHAEFSIPRNTVLVALEPVRNAAIEICTFMKPIRHGPSD